MLDRMDFASSFAASSSRPVARLVAAGLASRFGFRVDRLEDLELAIDWSLRQPLARDVAHLSLTPTRDALEVELGPLAGSRLDLSDLEGVLSLLVDELRARRSGADVWIALRMRRPAAATSPGRP